MNSRRADPATSFRGASPSGNVHSISAHWPLRVPEPEAAGVDRCSGETGRPWRRRRSNRGAGHFEGPGRGHRAGRRTTLSSLVAPASKVYTGAVRPAWPRFPSRGRQRRAAKNPLISSALWGFPPRPTGSPYYRFSMGARLPKIGRPARLLAGSRSARQWRGPGHDKGRKPRPDMRPGPTPSAWKPKQARLVNGPGLHRDRGAGARRSPTWPKAVRGDVARIAPLGEGDAEGSRNPGRPA